MGTESESEFKNDFQKILKCKVANSHLKASCGVKDAKTKGVKRGDRMGVAVGPLGIKLNLGVILSDDLERLNGPSGG